MSRTTLIHLPVADLARSVAFYEAVGARRAQRFNDDAGTCVMVLQTVVVKLTSRRAVDRPADRHLPGLSVESREAVDARIEAAWDAGGRLDFTRDQDLEGVIYGRVFHDPDGHVWTVRWMDPAVGLDGPAVARRAA